MIFKYLDEYKKLYNSLDRRLLSRESYIKKHYTHIHTEISSLFMYDMKFGIKSYYYMMSNLSMDINICVVVGCSNATKFINISKGFHDCCSLSCSAKNSLCLRKKTMLDRYAVEFALQSEVFKDKFKSTSIDRYDVDNPSKSDYVKSVTRETCMMRYGYPSIFLIPNVIERIKNTNIVRYDNESYFGSLESSVVLKGIMGDRYSVNYVHEISRSADELVSIKNKRRETLDIKWYNNMIKCFDIIDYWDYPKTLRIKCDASEDVHEYVITNNMLHQRVRLNVTVCTVCNPVDRLISNSELQLLDFIKSLYSGNIITNDRSVLNGKELDIYLPDLNIAFEYNGMYWHSDEYKDDNYHKTKTDLCKDRNINLFHIFEDDWLLKCDIIKSMLTDLLVDKIDISLCDFSCVSIDSDSVVEFLNSCNLQGYKECDYSIGIVDVGGSILCLLSFNEVTGDSFELLSFTNSLFSKYSLSSCSILLFDYLKSIKSDVSSVVSYVDRSIGCISVLEDIGLIFDGVIEPSYRLLESGYRVYNSGYDVYVNKKS